MLSCRDFLGGLCNDIERCSASQVTVGVAGRRTTDTMTLQHSRTYFTMPYPKLMMITRRRASVLLIADINSANISKLWAEEKKSAHSVYIWRLATNSKHVVHTATSDLRWISHI